MNKNKNSLLTKNQLTFLIIGFALGPAFFKLPNALSPISKQDSWISATIALLYPLYMLIIANYIISNHPKENLLMLNKKYFGCIFGSIFNSIFLMQVIFYTCAIILDFSTLIRLYIVAFLTPIKVILITIFLCVYLCSKGLKVLSQITELVSYFLFFMILFSFSALKYGSILNIQPIMGSNLKDIFSATKESAYFYIGFEFLLLYHPFAKDTKDIKKASIRAITIAGLIWVWSVFITTYYLGIDIIPKSFYSFLLVFESIHVPILNNFRYIIMFVWTLISFRIISIYYFSSSFILNDFTKIHIKKLNLLLSPIVLFLCTNSTVVKIVFDGEQVIFTSKLLVVFNIIFLSILSLLVFVKSKCETQI
ncbi:GerAB/ArcD/ProY family transporter [Clostridium sp.]|uniref:GerAB/ArcD/ProY family transporter n=1 Tax=Clostridium sp. TaxID=1506 RepID=UPI003F4BEEBC